jgi:hypothetical protein
MQDIESSCRKVGLAVIGTLRKITQTQPYLAVLT